MCLSGLARSADTCAMTTQIPVYRTACADCGLPALTFDRNGVPYCALHAVEFIPAVAEADPPDDEFDVS